ncbi:MAG: S-layer homology domain-containing protein [Clostridia bacterium]|nr:S-layer homology domain-containing protein [Clostridia bacterium]
MKKRLLAILTAVLILIPVGANAANPASRFDMLAYLDVMVGYGDGDLGLDRLVTRAEFSKMALEASPLRNSVAAKLKISPFSDVLYDKWYAPYVYLGAVNNIFAGYIDGTFRPDNNVTYEEAVMVALRLLGYSDEEFQYSWPYGPVNAGEKNGLCNGMNAYIGQMLTRDQVSHLFYNLLNATNGTKYITKLGYSIEEDMVIAASYNEVTGLSRGKVYTAKGLFDVSDDFDYSLVGYKGDAIMKDGKITAFFPYSKNTVKYSVFDVSGSNIILFKDGAISDYTLQGGETVYYNLQTMTVDSMNSVLSAGDTLDFHYAENGELDYIVYYESELDGPYIVKSGDWTAKYGISSNAAVMRAGVKADINAVSTNDVIYYSKNLNTVWAYNDTVTGVYESAQPNKNTPESVVVSGKTYTIESVEAYNALSSNGKFAYGDTVKLLLGKDRKIAGVTSPYDSNDEYVGFVVSSGSRSYTTQSNTQYTSNYINVALCDGSVYEYETDSTVSDNQVVRLSFENGKAKAKSLIAPKTYSGLFNYSNLMFDDKKISKNIEILEIIQKNGNNNISYGKVYPQRLDGVKINPNEVLYAETDSSGAVTKLILNDVTGDLYSYGIVTKATSNVNPMFFSGTYTYYDGVNLTSVSTQGSSFSVYAGNPVKIKAGLSAVPDSISQLTKVGEVKTISDAYINGTYKLYSGILVYENTHDYEYQVIDLNTLVNNLSAYTVTAYNDKTDSSGGRIRVLVAKKK